MKLSLSTGVLYLLLTTKGGAYGGIVRGSIAKNRDRDLKKSGGGGGGSGSGGGGGGGIRWKDGCPRSEYWNDPAYDNIKCSSNSECIGHSACVAGETCCCVSNFAPYCGNPTSCNDYITCMNDAGDSDDDEDSSDRGNGGNGGGLVGRGCDITQNEMWCAVINQCTQQTTCNAVVTDQHGCVTDYGEEWCEPYNLCMYPNINFLCPTETPSNGVCNTRLYYAGVASSGNDVTALQYGQFFRYGSSTTIRGVLSDGGDHTVEDINISLLKQDFQFPSLTSSRGNDCATFYEIKVYTAHNMCLLHICWDNILGSQYDDITVGNYDIPIPFCDDLNLPANNFYVLTFMVW